MEAVSTDKAPAAIGPYSQAIRCGDLLYLSGQIPLEPGSSGKLVGEDIVAQTKQVMENINAVLGSQKLTFKNVIKFTIYLKDISHFAKFNETYAEYLSSPYPARVTIEVAALPKGALIEIETLASVSG